MFASLRSQLLQTFLTRYKRNKLAKPAPTLDRCLDIARDMATNAQYCFLITHGESGWPSARLLQPIVEPETFTVWMGTRPDLRKIREIEADDRVTLAFQRTRQNANLILYGRAALRTDEALRERYWAEEWALFWPDGPLSDEFVLLRIEPERMELMNFSQDVFFRPFGFKPAILTRANGTWALAD